ncbi:MAG: molybdopterin molybdenumtransferase MoeA [Phycisphaera sp.]|nr:molybdopterin molybdenumtransferase MoeA [Phycisphaera sp.]
MKQTLPGYDEALARVLARVERLSPARVGLNDALGCVLSADVVADRDQPPFDRSAMDGFALRSGDWEAGATWRIAGDIAAGAQPTGFTGELPKGCTARIATGAPLPDGADVVVPIEQSVVEGDRVSFLVDSMPAWCNVHRRASDAKRGQLVMTRGTRLRPQQVGIGAAVGVCEAEVVPKPRVSLVTTGDEVVDPRTPTDQLKPSQIRNSNSPMVRALLAEMGIGLQSHTHVPDEPEATLAACREALSHSHLVITVGGVSVGQRDYLPSCWQRLGMETILQGVAIQPGRPVLAVVPPEWDDPKLVLGLPGNPVSVLATFHLFVWPVVRRMMGLDPALAWREVTLGHAVKATSKRQVFRFATLDSTGQAQVIPWQGSGDLMHTATATGLVRLPQQDDVPGHTRVPWLGLIGSGATT